MRIDLAPWNLPLPARRVFRLALTIGLAVVFSYALDSSLPYMAPIFALYLTATPGPPLPLKGLIGLLVLLIITLGSGLALVPVLVSYPAVGLMVVALGLYLSNDLSLNRGKGTVGTFLTVGLTLISAAGVASFQAALSVADAILWGILVAVLSQRIVYPFFPENPPQGPPPAKPVADSSSSSWAAVRTTLIVFPTFLLGLVNPTVYLSIILKAVSLGQQSSGLKARDAGRELLSSTFFGGCFAILFWFALKLQPNLLMFFLWMALFGVHFASKLYGVSATRFPASFWTNVVVTMLILVGPAVADSASGEDVSKAFAVRMALFVAVTIYAWGAVVVLENLRSWRLSRRGGNWTSPGVS